MNASPAPTHTLQGHPVHSLRDTDSPWAEDKTPWSRGIRADNGEAVSAPTWYFKPLDAERES